MPTVSVNGRTLPLPAARVRRIVRAVLTGERRRAMVSVTFLGTRAMRRLNLRYKGHDCPTDVLAFALRSLEGGLLGDIYICHEVAAREARALGVSPRQELSRLVVHGTLHLLGYDHPDGAGRTGSAMWRRQERYVRRLA